MILGVMSDTHGNLALMHRAAEAMVATHGVARLFHLGDEYADAEELRMAGYDVCAVPGLWCPEYTRAGIPKVRTEEVDGVTVACAHSIDDLKKRELHSDLVFTGHTHAPRIDPRKHGVRFNPGHLKADRSRGYPASYGVVVIEPARVQLRIHRMDGSVLDEYEFDRSEA